jgi:hypothetical protein
MTSPSTDSKDPELELLLEAARRANWNALHGPRYMRSGRFHIATADVDTAGGTDTLAPRPNEDPADERHS